MGTRTSPRSPPRDASATGGGGRHGGAGRPPPPVLLPAMADTAGLRAALGARIGAWGVREDLLAGLLRGGVPAAAEAVLAADLTDVCPSGSLPWDVSRAHRLSIPKDVLLQVEDVINVASEAPARRGPRPVLSKCSSPTGSSTWLGLNTPPWVASWASRRCRVQRCFSVPAPVSTEEWPS
ncbi:hypothetical protein I4F81_000026 [Pyropia yezoensis]|uniref:Uncharacterized protein n=1 Tax=Pyropia yezoensis TaxID=2788 RepID=A0ACC3BI14_PYRYE|nr:hypothetical protein I4F81_000026 [Neopyropia yezoensis]